MADIFDFLPAFTCRCNNEYLAMLFEHRWRVVGRGKTRMEALRDLRRKLAL